MRLAACAFCLMEKELRKSHVIPSFVFKWMKETSGTGHLRNSENPNVRVQDGLKIPLLCGTCEEQFGVWERAFATYVFHPYRQDSVAKHKYGDWCLKFFVSVSWRVATYLFKTPFVHQIGERNRSLLYEALACWRGFLMGERANPGRFEQHVLPFSGIEETNIGGLPPNINRYLSRTTQMDFISSEGGFAAIYTKMGPFLLFGHVSPPPSRWKGTRVAVKDGSFSVTRYELPSEILDYLRGCAHQTATSMQRISAMQLQKIDASMAANIDRFRGSELFKAVEADVNMFGEAALRKKSS